MLNRTVNNSHTHQVAQPLIVNLGILRVFIIIIVMHARLIIISDNIIIMKSGILL